MTLSTGNGGRYRYYKCITRIGQSIHACVTPAVPVAKAGQGGIDRVRRQGADARSVEGDAARTQGAAKKGAVEPRR
jgi:hypothetical protein